MKSMYPENDEHPPLRICVNGALVNSDEFHEAFKFQVPSCFQLGSEKSMLNLVIGTDLNVKTAIGNNVKRQRWSHEAKSSY